MLKFDKWKMPDGEKHLQEWMGTTNDRRHGRLTYQAMKYDMAMKYTRGRRTAVDVGAHIGLWGFLMAHDFAKVIGFEPMAAHAECWRENMATVNDDGRAVLYANALGAEQDMVQVETGTPGSSGDTSVVQGVAGDIAMLPLDHFNLQNVDLIKIDCEGYELNVLQGAVNTLKSNRPTVIVEQKRNMSLKFGIEPMAAVHFLESLGARRRCDMAGDYVLSW